MSEEQTAIDVQINPQLALAVGAGSFVYYALPDVIRSRALRTVIKTGLIGAMGAAVVQHQRNAEVEIEPDDREDLAETLADIPTPTLIAGGLALTGASIALTVWIEKKIFARGEARRAAGVSGAHTRQAIGLAALGAIAGAIE